MAAIVANVLQAAEEKESRFLPTKVQKDIEPDYDLGNLLAIDRNPIDLNKYRSKPSKSLNSLGRDNTQLLINKIWELKTERVEDSVVAALPLPTTLLPREKPIPKGKLETKWSKYAKLKGIQKKKKGRMIWDDEQKKWLPRWGYKRAGAPKDDWVLEVPDSVDPYEDQFEKKSKERKERIAKNELQRLRNIARNTKGKFKGSSLGVLPNETKDKNQLSRALSEARTSTASVGRFTDKLPKEKHEKQQGRKRKFESNFGSIEGEKKRALDMLSKMASRQPILDVDKAANKAMAEQDSVRAASKQQRKGGKPGKKQKGATGQNRRKGKGKSTKGGKRGKR